MVATEYAKMLNSLSVSIIVNFPNTLGIPVADEPNQLINDRIGALVVILSADIFPRTRKNPRFKIDTDIIQHLSSQAKSKNTSRIFLVLVDQEIEQYVKSTWIAKLQYLIDGAITREQVRSQISKLEALISTHGNVQSFEDIKSVIGALEPGCHITEKSSERVSRENISYQLFECSHKVRKKKTNYIYLHRGSAIANTSKHIEENYQSIYNDRQKVILLPMEPGMVRPHDRLENVKSALKSDEVDYLEDAVFKLIVETIDVSSISDTGAISREFLDPQVRFASESDPSRERPFSAISNWLSHWQSGVLVIVGQGGIGKTWAMLHLRQQITKGDLAFSKLMDRRVVFITSTDINRGIATSYLRGRELTIYDLYVASCAALQGEDSEEWLDRSTFYNALELGNILVFIDGLDEVISRNRSRFNSSHFFNDLSSRFSADSNGKVVISCRNIFFDDDEFRIAHPYVKVAELLAFDSIKRNVFFADSLLGLQSRQRRAIDLSEQLAKLPDGRYVPFILSLIRDVVREEADGSSSLVSPFLSDILDPSNQFDRVVGQFCHREVYKVVDPLLDFTVDLQVRVFCEMARIENGDQALVDRRALERLLQTLLKRHDVQALAAQFESHPFISQEELKVRGTFSFRFDFMPEYFAMLYANERMKLDDDLSIPDIRLFNEFSGANNLFNSGLVERFSGDESDFRLQIIDTLERGILTIGKGLSASDSDLLKAESISAEFTFSCVSLVSSYCIEIGRQDVRAVSAGITDIFKHDGALRNLVILDGVLKDDRRLRMDFRDLLVENCLFNAFDFWNCQFNERTVFSRCRFSNCTGVYSRSTGVDLVTFNSDCQFDEEFERILADGNKRRATTAEQVVESVRSFVSDFHKNGGFRKVNLKNLERYYSQSHSIVPFKKMYSIMKRNSIVIEHDKGHYVEVSISSSAAVAAERLITQAVLMDPIDAVAYALTQ